MELHKLAPASGSTHSEKRIGRGQGSGHGGTSTRGHKGQKSRSGYSRKVGFQGGQMPLQRLVPKFGFKNINRVEYKGINIGVLQTAFADKGVAVIDAEVLVASGLVSKNDRIKILGDGTLTAKLDVKAHGFTKTAKAAIENLGGSTEILK